MMRLTASQKGSRPLLRRLLGSTRAGVLPKRTRPKNTRSQANRVAVARRSASRRLGESSPASPLVRFEWREARAGGPVAAMRAGVRRTIDAALGIVGSAVFSWVGNEADEAIRIEAETDRLALAANPNIVVVRDRSPRLQGGLSRRVPISIAAWNIAPPLR